MRTEPITSAQRRRSARSGLGCLLFLALCLPAGILPAAEAVAVEQPPPPVPPEAEAADQDLKRRKTSERWLDEAIFTEISPLTIPEIGIALPPDQEG